MHIKTDRTSPSLVQKWSQNEPLWRLYCTINSKIKRRVLNLISEIHKKKSKFWRKVDLRRIFNLPLPSFLLWTSFCIKRKQINEHCDINQRYKNEPWPQKPCLTNIYLICTVTKKGAGLTGWTAACHQGERQMFWLHFLGELLCRLCYFLGDLNLLNEKTGSCSHFTQFLVVKIFLTFSKQWGYSVSFYKKKNVSVISEDFPGPGSNTERFPRPCL